MSASPDLQLLFTAIHSHRRTWALQNLQHLKKKIFQVVPSDPCAKEGLSGYPMAAATGKHTQTVLSPVSLSRVNHSQVLLPSSERLLHEVLAGRTGTVLTQSTQGAGFTACFSRLSQYLSQTEASPSHWPCIPMPCWRLALILV